MRFKCAVNEMRIGGDTQHALLHTVTDLHQHREVGEKSVGLQLPEDGQLGAEQQVEGSEGRGGRRQRLQQHRHLHTEEDGGVMWFSPLSLWSSDFMFSMYSRRDNAFEIVVLSYGALKMTKCHKRLSDKLKI